MDLQKEIQKNPCHFIIVSTVSKSLACIQVILGSCILTAYI